MSKKVMKQIAGRKFVTADNTALREQIATLTAERDSLILDVEHANKRADLDYTKATKAERERDQALLERDAFDAENKALTNVSVDLDDARQRIAQLETEREYSGGRTITQLEQRITQLEAALSSDLVVYLHRQWEWSARTFGPGRRTLGVTNHIEKEVAEIRAKPDDLLEWVDVIILAMDGYWRHGGKPESLLADMQAKQDKNFSRQWPTPTSEDEAVEHVRAALSQDGKPADPEDCSYVFASENQPWRTGGKVPLNVYECDRPMFQCHTPEDARRIVDLLNVATYGKLAEQRARLAEVELDDSIACASREEIEDMLKDSVCDEIDDMRRFIREIDDMRRFIRERLAGDGKPAEG